MRPYFLFTGGYAYLIEASTLLAASAALEAEPAFSAGLEMFARLILIVSALNTSYLSGTGLTD